VYHQLSILSLRVAVVEEDMVVVEVQVDTE
jgi:hypothetical protein